MLACTYCVCIIDSAFLDENNNIMLNIHSFVLSDDCHMKWDGNTRTLCKNWKRSVANAHANTTLQRKRQWWVLQFCFQKSTIHSNSNFFIFYSFNLNFCLFFLLFIIVLF